MSVQAIVIELSTFEIFNKSKTPLLVGTDSKWKYIDVAEDNVHKGCYNIYNTLDQQTQCIPTNKYRHHSFDFNMSFGVINAS